jgi:hypothetical protein
MVAALVLFTVLVIAVRRVDIPSWTAGLGERRK